jgi:hypothetical protein
MRIWNKLPRGMIHSGTWREFADLAFTFHLQQANSSRTKEPYDWRRVIYGFGKASEYAGRQHKRNAARRDGSGDLRPSCIDGGCRGFAWAPVFNFTPEKP